MEPNLRSTPAKVRIRWPGSLLGGLALLVALPLSAMQADDDPWLRIIIELEAEGSGAPTFHFHEVDRMPDTLRTLASEVEEMEGGGLSLAFDARHLDDILPLLRLLPEDRSEVRVVIRIPPNLRGADLWDFQARLSTERLRRVRIEFGIPPEPGPLHISLQKEHP